MTTSSPAAELPEELQYDAAWQAVLFLLEEAFPNDPRVWSHVRCEGEVRRCSIHFHRMLNSGVWSGSERILIEVAASLFDSAFPVSLWQAGYRVSGEHWPLVLEALRIFREAAKE